MEGFVCQNRKCPHNFFWKGLKLRHPKETETSVRYRNCMCNLDGEEITQEEIGKMWGMTRQAVQCWEAKATKRLTHRIRFDKQKREELRLLLQPASF